MAAKRRRAPEMKRRGSASGPRGAGVWIVLGGLFLVAALILFVEHSRSGAEKDARTARTTATPPRPASAGQPQQSPAIVPRIEAPRIEIDGPPSLSAPRAPATDPSVLLDPLTMQIVLDRLGFSSGSIDGVAGGQTRLAIAALRARFNAGPGMGLPDVPEVRAALQRPLFTETVVTQAQIDSLRPAAESWEAKAALDRLGYVTILELVSEEAHAHPDLIRRLNPGIDWSSVAAGTRIRIPDPRRHEASLPASALIRISLRDKTLQAFDARGRIVFHCPVSIARRVEKRPQGILTVVNLSDAPNYTFDPATFPDSAEAQAIGRRLIIQPGPNNPVGTTWIGLNLPGYGIHGTPHPEQVGRTESSGCFRLANWNASHLLRMVSIGTRVDVVD